MKTKTWCRPTFTEVIAKLKLGYRFFGPLCIYTAVAFDKETNARAENQKQCV